MSTASSSEETHCSIPVATPLFYDILIHDQDFAWVDTLHGFSRTVPVATEVAIVEKPKSFPEIPYMFDECIGDAAEGLFEVANILEALRHPKVVEESYRRCVIDLEKAIVNAQEISNDKTLQTEKLVEVYENATFKLEALIGVLQLFGGVQLSDLPGTRTVGVLLTFVDFSFEENCRLNSTLVLWMRAHWGFPFPTRSELFSLTTETGFEADMLLLWLDNARALVWRPLVSSDLVNTEKESGSISSNKYTEDFWINQLTRPERLNDVNQIIIPTKDVMKES